LTALDTPWMDQARCRSYKRQRGERWPWDTDQVRGKEAQQQVTDLQDLAKAICASCPVRLMCREYGTSIDHQSTIVDGIWGGETPEERAERQGLVIRWVSGQRKYATKPKVESTQHSRFRGVTWRPVAGGRYQAQLKTAHRNHYLGLHDTEEDAALAYNKKALEIFGPDAELNDVGVAA
jgi:transcription factor WhiB